jgi:hypothetical protein
VIEYQRQNRPLLLQRRGRRPPPGSQLPRLGGHTDQLLLLHPAGQLRPRLGDARLQRRPLAQERRPVDSAVPVEVVPKLREGGVIPGELLGQLSSVVDPAAGGEYLDQAGVIEPIQDALLD